MCVRFISHAWQKNLKCRSRMLREILALVRQKVTGERRKFNNKQLHNLNSTIIRPIKSRTVRLAGHIACTELCKIKTQPAHKTQTYQHQ